MYRLFAIFDFFGWMLVLTMTPLAVILGSAALYFTRKDKRRS
jgi:hypothetical protein